MAQINNFHRNIRIQNCTVDTELLLQMPIVGQFLQQRIALTYGVEYDR
jgi:hypothetical protein